MIADTVLALQHDPPALERAYRERPDAFAEALAEATARTPGSLVLQAWALRLDVDPSRAAPEPTAQPGWTWAETLTPVQSRALWGAVVGLVAVVGTWAKVPDLIGWDVWDSPNHDWERAQDFWQRFLPFMAVGPLLVLFALRYRPPGRMLAALASGAGLLLAVQAVRPIDMYVGTLSSLHVPLLLLSLAGVAALGDRWRNVPARMAYLQLVGETAALAALFLLGGVVLVAITGFLFSAIGVSVEVVLFEWIVVYGALGVLPVGALAAGGRVGAARVAPLVARTFGPLALAVFAVYLPVLLASGGLEDRDALLSLNVALVAVLALVVLIEAERPDVRRHWTDVVAAALVAVALVADLAAFVQIVDRLGGGLTPNRLAVVGLNALVATHFAGLVLPLARRALGRGPGPDDAWTARFLTVYAAWGAAVVLGFPLVF
jgi:hypothetical protein